MRKRKRKFPSSEIPATRLRLKKEAIKNKSKAQEALSSGSSSSIHSGSSLKSVTSKKLASNQGQAQSNEFSSATMNELNGVGDRMFNRAVNLRGDARTAASIISLGVLPLEEAEELLRKGLRLAKLQADQGKVRAYASCMAIALAAARLEIEANKLSVEQHEHRHVHFDTPAGSLEVDARASRILAICDSTLKQRTDRRDLPATDSQDGTEH